MSVSFRDYLDEIYMQIEKFPDTMPYFEGLGRLLNSDDSYRDEVRWIQTKDTLMVQLEKYLLHPGSSTLYILRHMANCQRSLKIVDKRNNLFCAVSRVFCTYLRGREDTVKCIIKALSGYNQDAANEIFMEEFKALDREEDMDPRVHAMRVLADEYDLDSLPEDNEEIQRLAFDEWEPEPLFLSKVEIDPLTKRSSSVLTILVQIYGSKDMFVQEYQSLLANKLLPGGSTLTEDEIKREYSNYSLLCLKFGEESMRNCEVMLNDFKVSQLLHRELKAMDNFDILVVSKHFWPALNGDMFLLPNSIKDSFDRFEKKFVGENKKKRLEFMPQLGEVEIELEYEVNSEMKVKTVTCTPLQAALLLSIQQEHEISVEALSDMIGVLRLNVEKALIFWKNLGVIVTIKSGGVEKYVLTELPSADVSVQEGVDPSMIEPVDPSVVETPAVDMSVYTTYITGMLKNLGGMPVDRIHNTLKMFVQGAHSYTSTKEELVVLLTKLVNEGELIITEGSYSIAK